MSKGSQQMGAAAIPLSNRPFGLDIPSVHHLQEIRESEKGKDLIKELRNRMSAFYKQNIAGREIFHPDVGLIQFDNGGKIRSTSADPLKISIVPELIRILQTADYIELQMQKIDNMRHQQQSANVRCWHWLENSVLLDGRYLRVGMHIREDNTGLRHYNVNFV